MDAYYEKNEKVNLSRMWEGTAAGFRCQTDFSHVHKLRKMYWRKSNKDGYLLKKSLHAWKKEYPTPTAERKCNAIK